MNNYIILDTFWYKTPHPRWIPKFTKAGRARLTLAGKGDFTYASGAPQEWEGIIIYPENSPGGNWGDRANIETSLKKMQGLAFQDHHGDSYTVHAQGTFPRESRTPMWDGASNEYEIQVTLLEELT